MSKTAQADHSIHTLIAQRWSPYGFSQKALAEPDLTSLFEAARWAPSCFNAQPWRFLWAQKSTDQGAFDRLAECLVEGNAWAKQAPVLMLSVAQLQFERNAKPNRHAAHDLGMAVQNMALQGLHQGILMHQMGGFDAELARELPGIPDGYDPMAMIALGYPGELAELPENLGERDRAPRSRKPIEEIVLGSRWS